MFKKIFILIIFSYFQNNNCLFKEVDYKNCIEIDGFTSDITKIIYSYLAYDIKVDDWAIKWGNDFINNNFRFPIGHKFFILALLYDFIKNLKIKGKFLTYKDLLPGITGDQSDIYASFCRCYQPLVRLNEQTVSICMSAFAKEFNENKSYLKQAIFSLFYIYKILVNDIIRNIDKPEKMIPNNPCSFTTENKDYFNNTLKVYDCRKKFEALFGKIDGQKI